ncbi:nuclear transport factor 2 family protein [Nocardioides antri]|uniref:nuclear transport factor 2 family protein n=1 Tax=Nocardioides antri TaxID=2607659 RepID=UPI001CB6D672|nr:nuclear transport factor 2 family protein [Nocardioides antri]
MTTSAASAAPSVAVLGLGRMGAATARRLHGRGHPVVTWSRSGRTLDEIPGVAEAPAAVAAADVVVLCLFDGPACAAVVGAVRDGLADRTVVNTSTVGVSDAVALAADVAATGAGYVHAPVLGSVPAVLGGDLTVLLGADREYDAAVTAVLEALGDVVPCGGVADAAAAKLLANGVLASGLLGLRDSRVHAAQLGIGAGRALAVLERTLLGRLVTSKRAALEKGDFSDADFTVGALAKDLALLAAGAPAAGRLRDEVAAALAGGAVGPDDDIIALCVTRPDADTGPHGLTIAPEVVAPAEVFAPLAAYVAGHATGDAAHHRRAFLPTAHVEGVREGAFVSWSLEEYCALFPGRPADDEDQRRRRIDRVEVAGAVATAAMTLRHGPAVFTDLFLLVRVGDEWRIANKVYDRA